MILAKSYIMSTHTGVSKLFFITIIGNFFFQKIHHNHNYSKMFKLHNILKADEI